jgi:tRNA(His) 5'-end guanylyltransferase
MFKPCHTHTSNRMCAKYGFEKPNDRRALELMNAAAKAVMSDIPEITIGYGISDEYRYYTQCAQLAWQQGFDRLIVSSSTKHAHCLREDQGKSSRRCHGGINSSY